MRVVQLLPSLVEGGVERGVVESNREYVKRGIESFVISSGGKLAKRIEEDGGVHLTLDVKSKNPLTFILRVKALQEVLNKLKPDIIHARSRIPAWLSYFAKGNYPFVTTIHGFNSVNFYSSIMTKGDRVICVSSEIKKFAQLNYSLEEERARVIFRGVDLDFFNLNSLDDEFIQEFKKRYQLQDRLILTAVGRITQLKGYGLFIQAVAKVKEKNPKVVGLIVGGVQRGKEEYFKKLKALNSSLKNPVIFCGSTSKVPEIYALSDFVVSSSLKPESFGRSLVEAMAMETPVIAPKFGGALDIVQEGKGVLFTPKDINSLKEAILKAQTSSFKDLRGYVKRRFSLEQMVEKTLAVYRELL